MGLTAEIVAERYGVSREDQDAVALLSQQRYAAAVEKGWIAEEIVPMKVRRKVMKKGEEPFEEDFVAALDECNRPSTTLEGLAKLKPVFKEEKDGGTVTAGNASQLSDGASATLVMSAERAKQLGVDRRRRSDRAPISSARKPNPGRSEHPRRSGPTGF